jgi:hypothetical protein
MAPWYGQVRPSALKLSSKACEVLWTELCKSVKFGGRCGVTWQQPISKTMFDFL